MKKITLSLIFLSFIIYHLSFPAYAQTPTALDLSVSPALLDITARPGDTISQKIRVRNNTEIPFPLSIRLKKITSSPLSGNPIPLDPKPTDDYISWVKFDEPSFIAPPKEWKDVTFTLTIPKTAAYGYYYAIDIQQANVTTSKNNVSVQGEVLIMMLLNVQKTGAKAAASLVSFTPTHYVNEYVPVTFNINIANTGNIHIKPRGNIFIAGAGQKDIAVLEVNPSLGAILPNSKRLYQSQWDDGFFVWQNNGLTINWDKLSHIRFGKYTANLLMVFDNGTRDVTLEATTSFWVIPYTLICITLVSVIILFFVVRFFIQLYIRKEIRKYQSK